MTQQLYKRPISRRARNQATPRSRAFRSCSWWRNQYFLAVGWGVATVSILFNANSHLQANAVNDQDSCRQIVQSSSVLSRAQLVKILAIPERSSQDSVKSIVAEPYCQLPNLELREGVTAEREAYPLAFAPTTWLVMLYEEGEYAGFAFSFQ